MDFEEEVFGVIVLIGAIVGVIGCEYLYVTNADEVRLLWIIVLIPVGAIAGALAAGASHRNYFARRMGSGVCGRNSRNSGNYICASQHNCMD